MGDGPVIIQTHPRASRVQGAAVDRMRPDAPGEALRDAEPPSRSWKEPDASVMPTAPFQTRMRI